MHCKVCLRRLEDHGYDDGNYGLNSNKPCISCGKSFNEHHLSCGHCGETFCGSHVLPQNHNCQKYKRPVEHPGKVPAGSTGREESIYHGFTIVAGIGVFILGAWLYIGNTSGTHATFPFAGFITMTIGFVMIGAGAGGKL